MNHIYEKWMNCQNVDSDLKHEMLNMDVKDIEYSFTDVPLEFGTAGYRNKIGPGNLYMNIFTYQQLAVGYAAFVKRRFYKNAKNKNKRPTVLVAHDARRGNIEFSNAVIKALNANDINVVLFDQNLPMFTPIVSYTIRRLELDGGVNITASHNPKNYNGFKAYNENGGQLLPHECAMISSFLPSWEDNLAFKFTRKPSMISYVPQGVITDYFASVRKTLIHHKPIYKNDEPIIYSAHHGVGCALMADFLRGLGHNIIDVPSQNYYSSEFENSQIPNPEDPMSFKESIEIAKQHNAKTMIAVDPDGDRFAIAIRHNNKWRYLNGNETGILLTHYLLSYKNFEDRVPIIISTHVSNNMINRLVEHHSGLVLRTGTGFKYIGKAMDEIDENGEFVIGFEEAIGACTNPDIREKDGLGAAALVLDMLDFYKYEGLDLIDVLEKRIYPLHGSWYGETISVTIPGINWKENAEKLEERAMNLRIKKVAGYEIKDILWNEEGSCIEWILKDDSWIKFRISGTEPKFKIYTNFYFQDEEDAYIAHEKKKKLIDKVVYDIKSTLKIV